MVIVWRLRWNIIGTVLYIAKRATSSMGTVNKNSSYSPVWPWVWLFVFFRLHDLSMLVYVLFYLGQLSHFPSCCCAGVTNLNEPPSSLLLPPRYCGLGAGSIPLRAIVNKTQCETRGLFMSLVIYCWIGDVQDSQGAIISQIANYKYLLKVPLNSNQSINLLFGFRILTGITSHFYHCYCTINTCNSVL